ncbi:uncharacterized protein LOC124147945 [Haliotis rufescens]|uniref:uncharacterized protein LOC124147945 n=1 Tax=Haliotis rufescens TaxID=6454 RepID=UPI00201EA39C|nr:uncharacterized protein LOC124147945 [Haliotis rufescens]XP_048255500.1 uncharacterized protein LOC124147945 [Haliotis rufescens]
MPGSKKVSHADPKGAKWKSASPSDTPRKTATEKKTDTPRKTEGGKKSPKDEPEDKSARPEAAQKGGRGHTSVRDADGEKPPRHVVERNTTKLFEAVKRAQTHNMEEFIRLGGNVNGRDEEGKTPLIWAAELRNNTVQTLLCHKNVDVNASDKLKRTALHFESAHGDMDSVKQLLAHGARIDTRDSAGRTPLHFAVNGNHFATADILVFCGADGALKDKDRVSPESISRTPQMASLMKRSREITAAIKHEYITVQRTTLIDNSRTDLDSIGLAVQTPKLFSKSPVCFLCRRVRPEYSLRFLGPIKSELLISDTFEFRISGSQFKGKVKVYIPMYDKPEPYEEVHIKTNMKHTLREDSEELTDYERLKNSNQWICSVDIDLKEINAFLLVTRPRVEYFNVGSRGGQFVSEVDDFIKFDIPSKSFSDKGSLSLELIPRPAYDNEDLGLETIEVASVSNFYDVNHTRKEQPQNDVTVTLPLPRDYMGDGGDLYVLNRRDKEEDESELSLWEIVCVNPKVTQGKVMFKATHFCSYGMVSTKQPRSDPVVSHHPKESPVVRDGPNEVIDTSTRPQSKLEDESPSTSGRDENQLDIPDTQTETGTPNEGATHDPPNESQQGKSSAEGDNSKGTGSSIVEEERNECLDDAAKDEGEEKKGDESDTENPADRNNMEEAFVDTAIPKEASSTEEPEKTKTDTNEQEQDVGDNTRQMSDLDTNSKNQENDTDMKEPSRRSEDVGTIGAKENDTDTTSIKSVASPEKQENDTDMKAASRRSEDVGTIGAKENDTDTTSMKSVAGLEKQENDTDMKEPSRRSEDVGTIGAKENDTDTSSIKSVASLEKQENDTDMKEPSRRSEDVGTIGAKENDTDTTSMKSVASLEKQKETDGTEGQVRPKAASDEEEKPPAETPHSGKSVGSEEVPKDTDSYHLMSGTRSPLHGSTTSVVKPRSGLEEMQVGKPEFPGGNKHVDSRMGSLSSLGSGKEKESSNKAITSNNHVTKSSLKGSQISIAKSDKSVDSVKSKLSIHSQKIPRKQEAMISPRSSQGRFSQTPSGRSSVEGSSTKGKARQKQLKQTRKQETEVKKAAAVLYDKAKKRKCKVSFVVMLRANEIDSYETLVECTMKDADKRVTFWKTEGFDDQKPSYPTQGRNEHDIIPKTGFKFSISGAAECLTGPLLEFHPKRKDDNVQIFPLHRLTSDSSEAFVDITKKRDQRIDNAKDEKFGQVTLYLDGYDGKKKKSLKDAKHDSSFKGFTSDNFLEKIAKELTGEWYKLGIHLGLAKSIIDNSDEVKGDKKLKMLILWRENCRYRQDMGVRNLTMALRKVGRNDIEELVMQELKTWMEKHKTRDDSFCTWLRAALNEDWIIPKGDLEPLSVAFMMSLVEQVGMEKALVHRLDLPTPQINNIEEDTRFYPTPERKMLEMVLQAKTRYQSDIEFFKELDKCLGELGLTEVQDWCRNTTAEWCSVQDDNVGFAFVEQLKSYLDEVGHQYPPVEDPTVVGDDAAPGASSAGGIVKDDHVTEELSTPSV